MRFGWLGQNKQWHFSQETVVPLKKKIYFSYNRTVLIRSFHLTMCHQDRKGLNGFISRSRSASTDFLMDFMSSSSQRCFLLGDNYHHINSLQQGKNLYDDNWDSADLSSSYKYVRTEHLVSMHLCFLQQEDTYYGFKIQLLLLRFISQQIYPIKVHSQE